MAKHHDTLSEQIEKVLAYPAIAEEPTDPAEQRKSAREAQEIKDDLEEQTGADLGNN